MDVTHSAPFAPTVAVRAFGKFRWAGWIAALGLCAIPGAAQEAPHFDSGTSMLAPAALPALPPPSPFNEKRILGFIPDYQTITDPLGTAPPLTHRQKWILAFKETADPFNLVNAALGAGFSQDGNQTPKYGEGAGAYAERLGAAWADLASQNFFSAGIFANLLHEDPRYFRKGPQSRLWPRLLYSISRVALVRNDQGRTTFNFAAFLGMLTGIATSNLYYPSASVRGSVMACRLETSLLGNLSGNLISEFWPDLERKFLHRHRH